MSVTLELLSAIFLFSITHFFIKYYFLSSLPRPKLPPGPGGWPVVGCLPRLGTMPHVALAQLAKKHGPVMYLKMGSCDMVVASSPGAARAFLETLDHNFSNRPPGAGATHIAYGAQDFVFADIGPRWNLFRKLSNLHMLGAQSYKDWALIREKELGHVIQDMFRLSRKGQPVVVPEMLLCAMANLIGQKSISRRVFATQGSESNEFKYMVVELMRLAGLFNIGDFIPSIAWLDLQGIEGKMKSLHKQFDGLLTKMIEEHSLTAHEREGNPDFLDIVMANREVSDGSELTMTNIKALLLSRPSSFDSLHDALKVNGADISLCCDSSKNDPNDFHLISFNLHMRRSELRRSRVGAADLRIFSHLIYMNAIGYLKDGIRGSHPFEDYWMVFEHQAVYWKQRSQGELPISLGEVPLKMYKQLLDKLKFLHDELHAGHGNRMNGACVLLGGDISTVVLENSIAGGKNHLEQIYVDNTYLYIDPSDGPNLEGTRGPLVFYSIPFDFFGDGGDDSDDNVNSSNPDVEGIVPFYKTTDIPPSSTLSSVGSSLFVAGGTLACTPLGPITSAYKIHRFDTTAPPADGWPAISMLAPRASPVTDGKLYVFVGCGPCDTFTEMFDPCLISSTSVPLPPTPRWPANCWFHLVVAALQPSKKILVASEDVAFVYDVVDHVWEDWDHKFDFSNVPRSSSCGSKQYSFVF
ncbi:hypothetical protein RHMOL_Rhmol03G0041400 [Rhododendron molle]|uniref:Uncharacterized protein n=1 Tax=Rhododendron molle TaxID=49168 RepID=A0ACC0PBJ0_RHOML|nr:hypothetical protein RHMOL_Rhmol03G0041400 [Rhododendron molle]